MNSEEIIAKNEAVGKRLDMYIPTIKEELSRSTVQRLIEEGNITVNNQEKKGSYKIKINDKIKINIPEAKEINLKAHL